MSFKNNTTKTFEEQTRDVFNEIHLKQIRNEVSFSRLSSQLSEAYLQLPLKYFEGKHCLDAGCGSNVHATYNMLSLGAKHVTSFDLNEKFFESAHKILKNYEGKYTLDVNDVTKMTYKDNSFDFVLCGGVLHHSRSVPEGIKELCRVLKNGGHIHIFTYGSGGMIRQITSYLRDLYASDSSFKKVIDDLDVNVLRSELDRIMQIMHENGDSYARLINLDGLKELIDSDLVLTIQDRIQAPVYIENKESEVVAWLQENGIAEIKRVTRYPHLKNVRRFLSPYYFKFEHPVAKFLYGDGVVQLVGKKDIS